MNTVNINDKMSDKLPREGVNNKRDVHDDSELPTIEGNIPGTPNQTLITLEKWYYYTYIHIHDGSYYM